ncbi:hypothetical protein FOC1_g10009336 [Fusarium oxysporum f. sp. cubense race 1]|uniref:WSC domain-containing protein n=1 Tax=Fusarium oxysporum f. sp. cubense (strain race 1) TaxID=1229664 RepID=N4U1V2_FUSC1|nr:hypothetical protein FOC1_g10009336 [Fusarium oxysporum f. sp. cubense race 1]
MRFSTGLLLAAASSVMGQRFTNSSIPATESATTTSEVAPTGSAEAAQPVDLGGATLGPGASFITRPDGTIAISLLAGPFGIASFSIGIPNDIFSSFPTGNLFIILFEILVELIETQKRAETDCSLDVTVDGVSVFSEGLSTGSGSKSSDSTPSTGSPPNVEFVQSCGATSSRLEVSDLAVGPPGSSNPGAGNGGGTVFPTGTQTGTETETAATNSEGATTNSEGETIQPTGTETTAPTSSATSAAGFPGSIGDFVLFGCVGSTAGFPTFELAQSSGSMDLNLCASVCEGRAYFGVHDEDCYCGDEIDADNTSRVDTDQCDIECPGDDSEFCGGDAPLARRSRIQARQSISNTIRLTVYVAVNGPDVTITDVLTATVTDQSTLTTTFTTTISDATATETQTVTAIYVCSNGKCYPENDNGSKVVYIFVSYPGDECDGELVYISEACDCQGGSQYVPKYCSNGSCHGLTVYKPEECHDWYNQKNFFVPADCDVCEHGDVVYKPWENSWGTPAECKEAEVPSCTKDTCPTNGNGGSGSEGSGSKGSSGSEGSGSKGESGSEGSGSKGESGSEGSGSKGESGSSCEGDHCVPVIVSSAGKQAVSALALLAAVAALL